MTYVPGNFDVDPICAESSLAPDFVVSQLLDYTGHRLEPRGLKVWAGATLCLAVQADSGGESWHYSLYVQDAAIEASFARKLLVVDLERDRLDAQDLIWQKLGFREAQPSELATVKHALDGVMKDVTERFSHDRASVAEHYDAQRDRLMNSARLSKQIIFIELGWIGCVGHLVERASGAVHCIGSGLGNAPVGAWLWSFGGLAQDHALEIEIRAIAKPDIVREQCSAGNYPREICALLRLALAGKGTSARTVAAIRCASVLLDAKLENTFEFSIRAVPRKAQPEIPADSREWRAQRRAYRKALLRHDAAAAERLRQQIIDEYGEPP